jgi:putative transposase
MFYQSLHTSKQSIHQHLNRLLLEREQSCYLSSLISEIRADHPTLSCRAMYYKLRPERMGRDAFEELCKELGFLVDKRHHGPRTTNSSGVVRFDNLLSNTTLTSINQAWSSDITYFEVDGHYYYITFVLDCYSRRILGHQVSRRLTTEETTLPALKKAVSTRSGHIPANVIFHSDGGGQYYDKDFLKFTASYQFRNSMCEYAYENGKAERLNGTIKNNYLNHYTIKSFSQLQEKVDLAVTLYNRDRPHKALNYQSPIKYENSIVIL